MKFLFNFCLLALSAPNLLSVSARDVPANVRDFYNSVKKAGQCRKKLKDGFYSIDPSEGGKNVFAYCGDHLSDDKIIYIQGPKGKFANMDIDCDGEQHGPGDDGRCESSGDTQSQTSFKDTVASYKAGVKDLNAFVHSYVVFGNVGKKNHYIEFKPEDHGVKPLSVMAVVCGDKMIYGVWGDENGDDGPPMVGEASISLATACFGKKINGNSGHDEDDVLYIAFTGQDAVPGAHGAAWSAKSYDEFEKSITALGDKLVARIGGGGKAMEL